MQKDFRMVISLNRNEKGININKLACGKIGGERDLRENEGLFPIQQYITKRHSINCIIGYTPCSEPPSPPAPQSPENPLEMANSTMN